MWRCEDRMFGSLWGGEGKCVTSVLQHQCLSTSKVRCCESVHVVQVCVYLKIDFHHI